MCAGGWVGWCARVCVCVREYLWTHGVCTHNTVTDIGGETCTQTLTHTHAHKHSHTHTHTHTPRLEMAEGMSLRGMRARTSRNSAPCSPAAALCAACCSACAWVRGCVGAWVRGCVGRGCVRGCVGACACIALCGKCKVTSTGAGSSTRAHARAVCMAAALGRCCVRTHPRASTRSRTQHLPQGSRRTLDSRSALVLLGLVLFRRRLHRLLVRRRRRLPPPSVRVC